MDNQEEVGLLYSILQRMSKGQLSQKVIHAFNALMREMELEDEDENQIAKEKDGGCTNIDCADDAGDIVILMKPECGSLFFLADGKRAGNYRQISFGGRQPDINLSVPGLEEWYLQWEKESQYNFRYWSNDQWKSWWASGLQLAREVKKQLPDGIRLYYFTINGNVWLIPPECSISGGVFDTGVPMRV